MKRKVIASSHFINLSEKTALSQNIVNDKRRSEDHSIAFRGRSGKSAEETLCEWEIDWMAIISIIGSESWRQNAMLVQSPTSRSN
jgi:hypothetical protein